MIGARLALQHNFKLNVSGAWVLGIQTCFRSYGIALMRLVLLNGVIKCIYLHFNQKIKLFCRLFTMEYREKKTFRHMVNRKIMCFARFQRNGKLTEESPKGREKEWAETFSCRIRAAVQFSGGKCSKTLLYIDIESKERERENNTATRLPLPTIGNSS